MSRIININDRIDLSLSSVEKIKEISSEIDSAIELLIGQIKKGGTIFWCGNGGSAADAQHMSAELMGKLNSFRKPIKSISLTTDSSFITAWSNDYSFDEIFSRQLEGLAEKNDVMIAITTSGKSKNIIKALQYAKKINMKSIILTSEKAPKEIYELSDTKLLVQSENTQHIQECFLIIEHIICENIDQIINDHF